MGEPNLCTYHGPGRLSTCAAAGGDDRESCAYRIPGALGCAHYRDDMGGACDNAYAQHEARNERAAESG